MRNRLMFGIAGAVAIVGVGIGAVTANTGGLDTWMSGMNHNRIIQVQNEGGVQPDSGKVGIAFFSNSAFQVTSPKGIRIMVDPWRNDPSGAWGLWYRMECKRSVRPCQPRRSGVVNGRKVQDSGILTYRGK